MVLTAMQLTSPTSFWLFASYAEIMRYF